MNELLGTLSFITFGRPQAHGDLRMTAPSIVVRFMKLIARGEKE
jgi:hypothetical protein